MRPGVGTVSDLTDSADRWEALATAAEARSAHARDVGIDLSKPGQSVGDSQARTYRDCAAALRLLAATGVIHCLCHQLPLTRPSDHRACEHVRRPPS
jgi:hypothetical protein